MANAEVRPKCVQERRSLRFYYREERSEVLPKETLIKLSLS